MTSRGLALLLAVSSSCLLTRPPKARYSYFVLTPLAPKGATERPWPSRLPVGGRGPADGGSDAARPETLMIAQVSLPDYLEGEQMVFRAAPNQIVFVREERWAEPLQEAFTRALQEDLAALLEPSGIAVRARGVLATPHRSLHLEVSRFERIGEDHIELWARWWLNGPLEPGDPQETRLSEPLGDRQGAAVAMALSRALATLSRKIAVEVLRP